MTSKKPLQYFPVISAIVPIAAVVFWYQSYLDQVITQNPIASRYVLPAAFLISGAAVALWLLLPSKKGACFAPLGALLLSILTVLIGLITPYRMNLLTSSWNLLIQTMNIITSVVSSVLFLAVISVGALTLCSMASALSKTEGAGWGQKAMWAVQAVCAGILTGITLSLTDSLGYSNMFLITGTVCGVLSLICLILPRIQRHRSR